MIQHCCKATWMRQPWCFSSGMIAPVSSKTAPIQWDRSAPVLQLSQCCSCSWCCSSSWETSQTTMETEVCSTKTEVKLACTEMSSHPWVPEPSFIMQTRTPNLQSERSIKHYLDWLEWRSSDWLVKMQMRVQLHTSDGMPKISVLLVEIWFQELVHKDGLKRQEHSAGGLQLNASFPGSTESIWGPCLTETTRLRL